MIPSEFYLYSGNAIDIFVSFSPWPNEEKDHGSCEENLILACDNQTSEFYKLRGEGCMLNLEVISIDGKEVDTKKHPLETLFFEHTNPSSSSTWTITYHNSSPIPVNFHWNIYR